jgi:hypothetical protein
MICRQLLKKKTEVLQACKFFTVTVDEVTTIDNGTWVSVTIYYIQDFQRCSMMATLEHIEDGATSNNLSKVIMNAVTSLTKLEREEIATRILAFGAGKSQLLMCRFNKLSNNSSLLPLA